MTFEPGRLFKDGGEGKIYEVLGHNDLLLKIYKDKDLQGKTIVTQELQHKLEYMKNNPPMSLINKGCLAWPIDILYSQGRMTGFVMSRLKSDYTLQQIYTYKHPSIDKNYDEYPSVQSRIGIAVNLAYTVSELHKAGYVIGDMNHENIGVDRENAQIRIFDCDSFTITDNSGTTLRTNVCMEGYLAPEIIKHCNSERAKGCPYDLDTVALPTFTKASDLFCLAVHIFRSLMNGISPFLGVNNNAAGSRAAPFVGNEGVERNNYVFKPRFHPSAVYCLKPDEIPPNIKSLFDRAFLDGNSNPVNRPSAEEWYNALSEYLGRLKQCSSNRKHQYYNTLSQCPYCEADKRHYTVQVGILQPKQTYNKSVPTQIVAKTNIGATKSSNQRQNTTVRYKKQEKHSGRDFLIAVASIVIGLMIIWPKDTNNKQSTEPQFPLQTSSLSQNVSQSDNQYLSTIISDETFSVEKFVHTDLNVRSGPGENYRSLFVVDQESLVKVSDTSKEKAWVKIKYNDNEHIGWVNGTYLRDFRIDSVTIENFDDKGAKITNSEKKLYASQMKYLGFSFNVIALNDYDENVKICAKITTPEKVFDINWSVEIKDEKGWNCWVGKAIPSDYYEKHPGKWKIQIYYKNPKNELTDKCYLFSKEFQLY